MVKLKRFSIITAVLNNAKGFECTADSMNMQDRDLYEWLVIDGGSTDGTISVANKNRHLIDTLLSEQDRGLYDAMNKGLALATAEYVLFLNSGDVLENAALRKIETAIVENHSTEGFTFIIAAAVQHFPSGVKRIRHPVSFEKLWHRIPSSHQAIFINRVEHLSVPHDLSYRVSSDYYTIAKIYQKRKRPVLYLDFVIVETPVGGSSFTSRHFLTMLRDHWRVQRTILRVPIIAVVLSMLRKLVIIVITRVLSAQRPRLLV